MSSSSFSKHFAHLQIPLKDILSATNSFSDKNLIGENEIRKAYKGKISLSRQQIDTVPERLLGKDEDKNALLSKQQIDIVAERLLGKDEDMSAILQIEISTLSSLKHENLVSIVGFCDEEDEKIIIYKNEANRSLDIHLGDPSLTWMQRLEICVGVARALSYIHYDEKRSFSLIHRNIRTSQILLDDKWKPKLSGFELSKMITTARRNRLQFGKFKGAKGYVEPTYGNTMGVTHKTDVYSLGVVLFEVLCGRRAYIPYRRPEKQFWKEESVGVVGTPNQIVEHDGSSPQLTTQQHSIVQESPVVMDEITESLDVVGKMAESEQDEGLAPQMAKQHSKEGSLVGKLHEVFEGEGLSSQLADQHSSVESLDVVGKLDETTSVNGSSPHLKKQLSTPTQDEMDKMNAGLSSPLTNQHSTKGSLSVGGKLEDSVEHEGVSPQLGKQNSTEELLVGKLEGVKCEGLSAQLVNQHSPEEAHDVVKNMDEMAEYEGRSRQLTKQPSMKALLNVPGKLDELVDHVGHSPPLAEQHSSVTKQDEIYNVPPPGISSKWFRDNGPPSFTSGVRPVVLSTNQLTPVEEGIFHMPQNISYVYGNLEQALSLGALQDMRKNVSYVYGNLEQPPSYRTLRRAGPDSYDSFGEFPALSDFAPLGNRELLAPLAIFHYDEETLEDIIDPDLQKQMDKESFKIFSKTAYLCLKEKRSERLHIDQILIRLMDALDLQKKHENRLKSKENPKIAAEVEGTSTNHLKWKGMEHLMIELHDIKVATKEFTQMKIGDGGFGEVYKAELKYFDRKKSSLLVTEGTNLSDLMTKIPSPVALKVFKKRIGREADDSFSAEIKTLTTCDHKNIVSLLGFCDDDSKLILAYEYIPNKSLREHLKSQDKKINLKWKMRLQICLDIAKGLNYLHTVKNIIHRDIKSDNILLDNKCRAKIGDFGLSKIIPENQEVSFIKTKVVGTRGYVDPEYHKTKKLKKASDIYSLGIILFEIVSGTYANDTQRYPKGLAHFAREWYPNYKGTVKSMVDPLLMEETDEENFTLSKGPNQDSLDTFFDVAYRCLENQAADRPEIGDVVSKIKEAMALQVNHKDKLEISLEDIMSSTDNFSDKNIIGKGGFGSVYHGRNTTIAAKRLEKAFGQGESEFLTEVEILLEYQHKNVIGLVGYCYESGENIIIYEYASRGSLDTRLKDRHLTWVKRLQICIDIASGLKFLHGGGSTQEVVLHRDLKSANILLMDDWKAKITDFGLSLVSPINKEMDFVIDQKVCGTVGYCDPVYIQLRFLTKESDIYSLGVVLLEILFGRLVGERFNGNYDITTVRFKPHYEKGELEEMVFEGIKEKIAPKSLTMFQLIACQCLHPSREKRPTAGEVLEHLEEALELQDDYDIWEPKLPNDYTKIIKMSSSPGIYTTEKKRVIHTKFTEGILLQEGKLLFTLGGNGQRTEMVSAKTFSYVNGCGHAWRSVPESRFQIVAEMLDILNLRIKIKTKPQLLSRDVVYGVFLVFKFCGTRKVSTKPLYVNL